MSALAANVMDTGKSANKSCKVKISEPDIEMEKSNIGWQNRTLERKK